MGEESIINALKALFNGKGAKDPDWKPSAYAKEEAAEAAFGYWGAFLNRLVTGIKRSFEAISRNKLVRHQRGGRIDLKSSVKIATDSPYCFARKLRGTNRRVAVASFMDFSGSMAGGTEIMGIENCKKACKTLRRLGLSDFANKVSSILAKQDANQRMHHLNFHFNLNGAFGNPSGLSNRTTKQENTEHEATGITFLYLENGQWMREELGLAGNTEVAQRVAGLFQRLQGQFIGANLIRKAFSKCGIAQYWGAFTENAHKVKGWNEKGIISSPRSNDLGGTNIAKALNSAVRELQTRPEERRIAFIMSDGSFDDGTSPDLDGNGIRSAETNYHDRPTHLNVNDFVKKAWAQGIEVYYIGLHVRPEDLAEAEEMLGKGHAIGVTDIATELPALMEAIVKMDDRDMRQTAKGQGYKIKR